MNPKAQATGPDLEAVTRFMRETYPEADVVTIDGGTFYSLDTEKHFPNFATVVWKDDFDLAPGMSRTSDLSRPGVFRLNLGVSRATFNRLVGSNEDPDYTAFDRFLPHPIYGRQLWISILNPSDETFREVVIPLIAEAHDRLAAQRARHARV